MKKLSTRLKMIKSPSKKSYSKKKLYLNQVSSTYFWVCGEGAIFNERYFVQF